MIFSAVLITSGIIFLFAKPRFRATAELLHGPVTLDKVSRTGGTTWPRIFFASRTGSF